MNLTERECALIEAAAAALPGSYVIEWDEEGGTLFVTVRPRDPRGMDRAPLFIIGRSGSKVAFVRWIDGSTFATAAFRDVEAPVSLMASGVFAAACSGAGVDVP